MVEICMQHKQHRMNTTMQQWLPTQNYPRDWTRMYQHVGSSSQCLHLSTNEREWEAFTEKIDDFVVVWRLTDTSPQLTALLEVIKNMTQPKNTSGRFTDWSNQSGGSWLCDVWQTQVHSSLHFWRSLIQMTQPKNTSGRFWDWVKLTTGSRPYLAQATSRPLPAIRLAILEQSGWQVMETNEGFLETVASWQLWKNLSSWHTNPWANTGSLPCTGHFQATSSNQVGNSCAIRLAIRETFAPRPLHNGRFNKWWMPIQWKKKDYSRFVFIFIWNS